MPIKRKLVDVIFGYVSALLLSVFDAAEA